MTADGDETFSPTDEVARMLAQRAEAAQLVRDVPVATERTAALDRIVGTASSELRVAEAELADLHRFSPAKLWAQIRGTRTEDIDRQTGVVERAKDKLAKATSQHQAASAVRERLAARQVELGDVDQQLEYALVAVERQLLEAESPHGAALESLRLSRIEADSLLRRLTDDQGQLRRIGRGLDDIERKMSALLPDQDWGTVMAGHSSAAEAGVQFRARRGGFDDLVTSVRSLRAKATTIATRHDLDLELPDVPQVLNTTDVGTRGWLSLMRPHMRAVRDCGDQLTNSIDEARTKVEELDQQRVDLIRQGLAALAGNES